MSKLHFAEVDAVPAAGAPPLPAVRPESRRSAGFTAFFTRSPKTNFAVFGPGGNFHTGSTRRRTNAMKDACVEIHKAIARGGSEPLWSTGGAEEK